jgi:hypothetical protein
MPAAAKTTFTHISIVHGLELLSVRQLREETVMRLGVGELSLSDVWKDVVRNPSEDKLTTPNSHARACEDHIH